MAGRCATDRREVERFVRWRPGPGIQRHVVREHLAFVTCWRERRQLVEAAWLRQGRWS